eukprot:COSAG01_NODE_1182_length_11347_cov_7.504356_8_plen_216_part_00
MFDGLTAMVTPALCHVCDIHPAERVCDGWQAGWPAHPLPLADNPGGRWQADGRETNSSFATLRFADANTATLELVAHTGCVLYRLVKPNPRSRQGGGAAAAAARVATEGGGGAGVLRAHPAHAPGGAGVPGREASTSDDGRRCDHDDDDDDGAWSVVAGSCVGWSGSWGAGWHVRVDEGVEEAEAEPSPPRRQHRAAGARWAGVVVVVFVRTGAK